MPVWLPSHMARDISIGIDCAKNDQIIELTIFANEMHFVQNQKPKGSYLGVFSANITGISITCKFNKGWIRLVPVKKQTSCWTPLAGRLM